MRILVANHANSPDHLGGAELSLLALIEEWLGLSPTPEIMVVSPGPPGTFSTSLGRLGVSETLVPNGRWVLPSFEANPAGRARAARNGLSALARLEGTVARFRPDVVLTNTISSPWAAVAAAQAGIPHYWMVREYGDLDHGLIFTLGPEKTRKLISDLSDRVIANSRAVARHFEESAKAELSPLILYPRGARALPEVPPPSYAGGRIEILAIARVTPTKGLGILPDALRILEDSGTDARVTVVGSEVHRGYRSQLTRVAQSLKVGERLAFKDERTDIAAEITAAHVGLSPGPWEAFGRTTSEYMILNRPAIASQYSGSAELLRPGIFGQTFDPEDPMSLANAVRWYSEQPDRVRSEGEMSRIVLEEATRSTMRPSDLLPAIESHAQKRQSGRELLAHNAAHEVVGATRCIARRVPVALEFPLRQIVRATRWLRLSSVLRPLG